MGAHLLRLIFRPVKQTASDFAVRAAWARGPPLGVDGGLRQEMFGFF
jgi:hypothetical protein